LLAKHLDTPKGCPEWAALFWAEQSTRKNAETCCSDSIKRTTALRSEWNVASLERLARLYGIWRAILRVIPGNSILRNVQTLRILRLISVVPRLIIPVARNPLVVINLLSELVDRCIRTVTVVPYSTQTLTAQSVSLDHLQQPIHPAFFNK